MSGVLESGRIQNLPPLIGRRLEMKKLSEVGRIGFGFVPGRAGVEAA
jgi:hypothetical protein